VFQGSLQGLREVAERVDGLSKCCNGSLQAQAIQPQDQQQLLYGPDVEDEEVNKRKDIQAIARSNKAL
jgi:hypothetical protein